MAGFTAGQGGQEEPVEFLIQFFSGERLVILYNRPDESEGESF